MTSQDYRTIIDLTAKHFKIDLSNVALRIKKVAGGRAGHNYITLPQWLEEYDENYRIYYAVHEVCHHIVGIERWHDQVFREVEDKALALWGLKIIRSKAYPKELYANGQKINNIVK
jgi:hypothetical protein